MNDELQAAFIASLLNGKRSCGACAACCTYLGIAELRKYSGQNCRHLDGRDPVARCSIYAKRPKACSDFFCGWRGGLFDDTHRPDVVGFIATPYAERWVILVFDPGKAGEATDTTHPLGAAVQFLLRRSVGEIVVVNLVSRKLWRFVEGKIYKGSLLPQGRGNYEDLTFALDNEAIGTYQQKESTS